MSKKNIAVFASGGGSNLQSIINKCEDKSLDANIKIIISNNSSAGALERGKKHKIKTHHISSITNPDKLDYDNEIFNILEENKIDIILLCGYMKLLPIALVEKYNNRILNIHPALLPKFGGKGMYGMNVHNAVIKAKEKQSGATVHLVTNEYDKGKIIIQESVDIDSSDSAETLASKVLIVEHSIYWQAVKKLIKSIDNK